MGTVKQAIAWWCFVPQKLSPEQFVRAVAEAGYAGIDLVPQEYWPLVAEHGLTISSINGHQSIAVGLNQLDQHQRIEQELLANIALAEQWQIPNLICFSGNRYGIDDASSAEITARGLRRVAAAAESAGVNLVLELLNSKVDHPQYQCDHTDWGVKVCAQVDSPRVRLLYDIYHMQIMEGDIIRTIQQSHQWFGHYHTAGNPGRHEIDATQELYYPPILQAITDTGYDGYIAHEFIPQGDALASIQSTISYCAPFLSSDKV